MSSEIERLKRLVNDLSSLLEATTAIAQDLRLNMVLTRVVQQAIGLCHGEAGTLWLADEQQNLAPVVIIGGAGKEQLAKMRLAPGEGVAGRVFQAGQPLLIGDVHSHPRWAQRFDNATGFYTRSIICTPLTARGRRLGSLQIINKQGNALFNEDDLYLLQALAGQASLILDSSLLLQQQERLANGLVEVVTAALDSRDPYNAGHSAKVAEYSVILGKALGLGAEELERLRRAALLHDIGKVGIPDPIIKKVIPLTPEEETVLRSHTSIGAEMLSKVRSSALTEAVAVARHHHERPDGQGYPDHLGGEQPHQFARIVAVADTFVRMTTPRPNKKALTKEEALAEINSMGTGHLDPTCAAAFIETMMRMGNE